MKPTRGLLIVGLCLGLTCFAAAIVLAQPPIPHAEEAAFEDCVSCHREGENGAPLMPTDHADYQNTNCRACHTFPEPTSTQTPPAETPLAETPSVDQVSPTEVSPTEAPPVEASPPNVPHPVAEWEDCYSCHSRWQGQVDIPNLADSDHDHTAYDESMCTTCHRAYDRWPPVTCSVCHPESSAMETTHNNPDNWVDCVACHQGADSYPHDSARMHSRNEDCIACHPEPYSFATHISRGDLHLSVDCAACHLETAVVERNQVTGRTQVILSKPATGAPPDDPALLVINRAVDCQRCHTADTRAAAPTAELPPRSILCLACHDAPPIVRDGLSLTGSIFFGLGMLTVVSIWLRGSVEGRRSSLLGRLYRILGIVLRTATTRRLFTFIRSFVMDGILHVKLFHTSKLRWLAHMGIFLGMALRMLLGIITWLLVLLAPATPLTEALVDKNSLAIALIYDGLGLAVILGAVLSIIRRYVTRDKQLITGSQDTVAIALLSAIFTMGFIVEGTRILVTNLPTNIAAFSFVGYLISRVLRLIPVNWMEVYGWLWYTHAGLVTTFIIYLPFGKFLHVLVGPIVAAFNSVLKEQR